MRFALVIPSFLKGYSHSSRSPAVARSGTFYFPIWLAYGAGALENAGHDVLLLDGPALGADEESLLRRIEGFAPDWIVVDVATPSARSDLEFARRAGALGNLAVGGAHVSGAKDEVAAALPEAARITSDYDDALLLLTDTTAPREIHVPAENLEGRRFVTEVYLRHLRIEDYFYACTRYPFVSILAARGCPYECVFCHWPATLSGPRYRTRSADDIVEEMLFVKKELPQVKEIFFEDDTFNIDERIVTERCEAMISAGVRIPWSANVRPKASREVLQLMRRAGCRLVLAGFESGDEAVLANVGKATDPSDLRQFSREARKAGLLVHGCFILGLPGETHESITKTIGLAMEIDPDTAQFYPYMPYPGTPGYAGWHGELSKQGRHSFGGDGFANGEIEAHCDAARRRFYTRPKYLARKVFQSVFSPTELVRNVKALRAFYPSIVSRRSTMDRTSTRPTRPSAQLR